MCFYVFLVMVFEVTSCALALKRNTGYTSAGLGSLHELVVSLVIGLVLIFGFAWIGRGNCSIIQDILDQSQPPFAKRILCLQLLLDRRNVFENNLAICLCSTRVAIPEACRKCRKQKAQESLPHCILQKDG